MSDHSKGGYAYRIWRRVDGVVGCDVLVDGQRARSLPHVVCHSPAGFEAGYSGSGPADLALSILAHYFAEAPTRRQVRQGACRCWAPHQDFKVAFITPLVLVPGQAAVLPLAAIQAWLEARREGSHGGA